MFYQIPLIENQSVRVNTSLKTFQTSLNVNGRWFRYDIIEIPAYINMIKKKKHSVSNDFFQKYLACYYLFTYHTFTHTK